MLPLSKDFLIAPEIQTFLNFREDNGFSQRQKTQRLSPHKVIKPN
jgi:hypothetical protein